MKSENKLMNSLLRRALGIPEKIQETKVNQNHPVNKLIRGAKRTLKITK